MANGSFTRRVRASAVAVGVAAVLVVGSGNGPGVVHDIEHLAGGHHVATAVIPPRVAPGIPPAVISNATPRVVEVVSDSSLNCHTEAEGTGWPAAPDYIVTNAHVVSGGERFSVNTPDGRALLATVVLFDPTNDVAVLHVPGLGLTPFAMGATPADGTTTLAIGYPEDTGEHAYTAAVTQSGITQLKTIYGAVSQRSVEILSAGVKPGDSGGPLIAANGKVVGLVFARDKDDATVGFADAPAAYAADVARGIQATAPLSTQTGPNRGCLSE